MERIGEVTHAADGWLDVVFCRPDECEGCHACEGSPKKLSVRLQGNAQVGDQVVVEMSSETVVRASATAYLLPLAGLMLGLAAGALIVPHSDAAAGIGAASGLVIGGAVIALTEKQRRGKTAWTPVVKQVLPKQGE